MLRLSGSSWAPWASAERMNLSGRSDTALEGLSNVRNIGFPSHVLNANGACTTTSLMHRANNPDPIAGVMSDRLRLKVDATSGQSGSPYFFCPEDGDHNDCVSDEPGVVYGLVSGGRFVGVNWREVSPKIANWRDDILLWINSF